jgi:hypothetical protein
VDGREQPAAQAVLLRERLHAGLPQLHETEFSGNKETVEGNEQQRANEGDELDQSEGLRQQKPSV